MNFFDKNSLWKHKNLGFLCHITHVNGEKYKLTYTEASDPLANMSLHRWWTAEELVREFTPQIMASRVDRLLDGLSALSDEEHPQG